MPQEEPFTAQKRLLREMRSMAFEARALRSERDAEPDRARRHALLVQAHQADLVWHRLFVEHGELHGAVVAYNQA